MKYKPTIGLEIHVELKTKTKMFCDSLNDPDEKKPNTNVCPVCMGHPGTLPVINKEAVKKVLMVGKALNGKLAKHSQFDRKNYFYPDIPKGYQISQYKYPLVEGGWLEIRSTKHDLPDGKAGIRNNIKIQNSKNHHSTSLMVKKGFVYSFVKKYYTKQEFEVLWSQLQQNFNCQETSSTGRILDAVSLLLGFCKNERNYKHEPIDLLEKASVGATPYEDIEPMIEKLGTEYCLLTTPLFEYLIKKIGGKTPAKGEARRLAATAQMYIAQGMYEIVKQYSVASSQSNRDMPIYFAGGIANNKIISEYLESKGAITNKKVPRGDAGLSFGQIMYYLANNST